MSDAQKVINGDADNPIVLRLVGNDGASDAEGSGLRLVVSGGDIPTGSVVVFSLADGKEPVSLKIASNANAADAQRGPTIQILSTGGGNIQQETVGARAATRLEMVAAGGLN